MNKQFRDWMKGCRFGMRILILSMVIAVLAGCGPSDKQRAQEAFEAGECQGAFVLYDVLVQESPRDYRSLVGAGLAQWCLGRFEEADALIGRALALDRARSEPKLLAGIQQMLGSPALYRQDFAQLQQLSAKAADWLPRKAIENPDALVHPLADAVNADVLAGRLHERFETLRRRGRTPPVPEDLQAWLAAEGRLPAGLRVPYGRAVYARASDPAQALTAEQRLGLHSLAHLILGEAGESVPPDREMFVIETVRSHLGEPRVGMPPPTPLMGVLLEEADAELSRQGRRDPYLAWILLFGRPTMDLGRAGFDVLVPALEDYLRAFPDSAYTEVVRAALADRATQRMQRALSTDDGEAFTDARRWAERAGVTSESLSSLLAQACADRDGWIAERQRCTAEALSMAIIFRDCTECPEMVVIPAGSFTMGSPSNEPQRRDDEGPQRQVNVPAFALGKYAVTFAQWDACVADGGCSHRPDDQWGRGDHPVMRVSWTDAQEYVDWLSEKTGEEYRLASESEWEYASRAGTTARFNTGDCITTDQANFRGTHPAQGCPRGENRQRTVTVGSFDPNAFGLYDMHGNVWEWVQDCWNDSYRGAPTDGSAWMRGNCDLAVLRGGSWNGNGFWLRSALRGDGARGYRYGHIGFRVARSVTL